MIKHVSIFSNSDFHYASVTTTGTRLRDIGGAKNDFKEFLYAIFHILQRDSNQRLLGFSKAEAHRMKDGIAFIKGSKKMLLVGIFNIFKTSNLIPITDDLFFINFSGRNRMKGTKLTQ